MALSFGVNSLMSGAGGMTDAAKDAGYGGAGMANPARGTKFGNLDGSPVSIPKGEYTGAYSPYTDVQNIYQPWFQHGGHVEGTPGIDQIPAMLSEGEYVIRKSSVQQLGKPMLDRMNAGKFADGGEVTPISEDAESSVTGGMTNNISISVNVNKDGGESKDGKEGGKTPDEASADNEKNRAMGERIKAQVVNVIREEQRPGGLLT